jgi:hypothetical protein
VVNANSILDNFQLEVVESLVLQKACFLHGECRQLLKGGTQLHSDLGVLEWVELSKEADDVLNTC